MTRLDQQTVDEVAQLCLSAFERVRAGGGPGLGEWTVLAGVAVCVRGAAPRLAALGSGSKCAGGAEAGALDAGGRRLLDCHAEVLARRALLRHLYAELARAARGHETIFRRDGTRFRLCDDVDFIFYSSQLPCGDASIVPMDEADAVPGLRKRIAPDDPCMFDVKRCKLEPDIHRTGAKCLPAGAQDPRLPGAGYHVTGQVRTKPGRGEPTLSVSCSDKIARWIHVGFQGALMHMLCGPLYIKHFIFGGGTPYSKESLERALLKRNPDRTVVPECIPEFYQSSLQFQYLKLEDNMRAAPGSIIYIPSTGHLEVAIQGRRQGLTKKCASSPKNALCVTKYKLYEQFMEILKMDKNISHSILGHESVVNIPYNEIKKKATKYLEKWSQVKEQFFGMWTQKPDVWNFTLDVV